MNKITAEEYKRQKEESGNSAWFDNRLLEVMRDILTKTEDNSSKPRSDDFVDAIFMLISRANYYIMLGKGNDNEDIVSTHLSDLYNVLEHIFEKDCAKDATIDAVQNNLDVMYNAYKNDKIDYCRK